MAADRLAERIGSDATVAIVQGFTESYGRACERKTAGEELANADGRVALPIPMPEGVTLDRESLALLQELVQEMIAVAERAYLSGNN
ncbi:hypothetical protein [Nonomuraea sp. NPDC050310]|uniref:hypothetical protein n=1 Tax=Nonomuraea sp. NPDC050310 TaxID=3154935 RepID=UPI0033E36881